MSFVLYLCFVAAAVVDDVADEDRSASISANRLSNSRRPVEMKDDGANVEVVSTPDSGVFT